jgi:hypothetical protein
LGTNTWIFYRQSQTDNPETWDMNLFCITGTPDNPLHTQRPTLFPTLLPSTEPSTIPSINPSSSPTSTNLVFFVVSRKLMKKK